MSENGVEIIHIPDDKENVLKSKKAATVNNNNIIPKNEKNTEKTKQAGENLLSPPRKKLKQESLPFPVIPKDEALEKLNNSIAEEKAAQVNENVTKVNGVESNCTKENESKEPSTDKKSTTPNPIKKTAKSPGLSKEEKERQRLVREQLKLEKQKEIEEKKRLKEEEKKKREEERLQKQAEKEKKEHERKIEKEKKEQERKEKEKLKEEDRKKKEEEKKKRDEQRENERREKEAEREKKEQEKKMEEEKKKMKEEAEKKKKEKAANQFKSFFTKKTTEKKTVEKPAKISRFANFQVTPNMTLAPCVRVRNFDKSKIDSFLEKDIADFSSYLEELAIKIANNQLPPCVTRRKLRKEEETKRKTEFETKTAQNTEKKDFEPKMKRRKSSSGLDQSMNSTDCVIINDDSNSNDNSSDDEDDNETSFVEDKQLMKAIYLKFDENTRPPYYGTWRKKSKNISGRKPFGQDTEIFNYDVDSDEEWIDEPGEDCSDNGEDDDEEVKETEEDQDGFFVPHGYLSDDEGVPDDDEDEENEENESEKLPVPKDIADAKREQDKLKSKVDSFEVAFKKKLKPRKPICIGIKFTNNIEDADPLLKDFYKISLYKSHGDSEANENEDQDGTPKKTGIEASGEVNNGSSVPLTVPEEAMPFLLKLVHGNATSIGKMIQEFQTYWVEYVKINGLDNLRKTISKKQCIKKMKEIATKGPNEKLGKICYTVNVDILQKYGIADLELGCGLTYPVPKETVLLSNGAKEKGADNNETVVNGDCIMLDTSKTEYGNLQNQNVDKIPNDVSIPAENKMEVD